MVEPSLSCFFNLFFEVLKATYHLQLFQDISYVLRVVQYILEPVLPPVVCISHSPIHTLPVPPSPLVTTRLFSIPVSLLVSHIHDAK